MLIQGMCFFVFGVYEILSTNLFHNRLQRDPPRSSKRNPLLENHHLYTAQTRSMLCFLLCMCFLELQFSKLDNNVNSQLLPHDTFDQNTLFTY